MRTRIARSIQSAVFIFALTIAPIALWTGCKSTLAPGGAYAPGNFVVATDPSGVTTTNFTATGVSDKAFFAVDSAYDFAYSTIDAAFTFERENRLALWKLSPDIKHTLDKIRLQAWDANVRYFRARQQYLSNPVPAGLSTLQSTLAELQNLAAAVQIAIAPAKTP